MADLNRPEQQKIDPTNVKKFWPGPITNSLSAAHEYSALATDKTNLMIWVFMFS